MTPDYVYLLVAADGSAFKIGRSCDPAKRAMWLPDEFDYSRSRHYRLWGRDGRQLEYALHFLFRSYRVDRPRCDGSSEWFDIEALDAVVDFLSEQQWLIRWDLVERVTALTQREYLAARDERRMAFNAERREQYARDRDARAAKASVGTQPRRSPPPRGAARA